MTTTLPPQHGPIPHRTGRPPTAGTPGAPGAGETGNPGLLHRWGRGPLEDPAWARPALLVLLGATAVLYVWNLSASGWANSFYSAAAQAGSVSWKAFFYGSSDAASSITVDKPPASLWPMALSVRLFGLSSWSVLLPQALMGVATVGVLYATVKRHFGAAAGLLAGAVLALTPVAALMFRFNNPDALLTLLLVLAAWTALRAVEDGRLRWFVATGALVGIGFLTKQLQVLLVLPGFALAGLVAGRGGLWERTRGLLVAAVSMVLAAGWWVAVVEVVPESWRPYIGGSQGNSFLELTFGYNGLGRITGDEVGSVGGPPTGGNATGGFVPPGGPGTNGAGPGRGWGRTGLTRLFDGNLGGQIAWLMPAALLVAVLGLWWLRRRPRTDLQRASIVAWAGWLFVTAAVFSFMGGIFHEYYTVVLAPAVGALVAIGAALVWERRDTWTAGAVAAVLTALSGWWATELLGLAPDWNPWLVPLVGVLSATATLGFVVVAVLRLLGDELPTSVFPVLGGVALVALLAGPAAWTLQTVGTAHHGGIVLAGPVDTTIGPGGGGGAPPFSTNGPTAPPLQGPTAQPPLQGNAPGTAQTPSPVRGNASPMQGGQAGAGPGGLLDAAEPSAAVQRLLTDGAEAFDWVAATVGANNAAGYQLATELPVMPIGGFNGSDPSPNLEQFQTMVAEGRVHWFISTGGGFPGQRGGSDAGNDINSWVEEHFEQVTVDGTVLYDLTDPTAGAGEG